MDLTNLSTSLKKIITIIGAILIIVILVFLIFLKSKNPPPAPQKLAQIPKPQIISLPHQITTLDTKGLPQNINSPDTMPVYQMKSQENLLTKSAEISQRFNLSDAKLLDIVDKIKGP